MKRRLSLVASSSSTEATGASDAEEERSERKERKKRQSLRGFTTSETTTSSGSPMPNDENVAGSTSKYSAEQLTEHYANCMKLSAENKISARNAFELRLIDYMAEMMRKKRAEMNNFQTASVALDASAKIYAYRVDNVHSETLKLASGVNSAAKEDKAGDNDEANEDGENANDGEDNDDRRKKKTANKRKRNSGKTIERNLKSINCAKFELEFDIDPLFKKVSAQFDSGGLAGHFLSTLHMRADNFELLLDSEAQIYPPIEANTREENESVEDQVLPQELATLLKWSHSANNDEDNQICPTFHDFKFSGWNPDDQADQFDRDVSICDNDDDNHVYDPDVAAAIMEDDDAPDTTSNLMTSVNQVPSRIQMNIADVSHLRDHLAAVPREYSYFDTGLIGAWAGPQHWKFKTVSSRQLLKRQSQVPDTSKLSKRSSKSAVRLEFEDVNDSEGEMSELIDHLISAPKKPSVLAENTIKGWSDEKTLLPEDLHYSGKDFVRLQSMRQATIVGRNDKESANKSPHSIDDSVADYNYDNLNDSQNFCPPLNNEDNDVNSSNAFNILSQEQFGANFDGGLVSAPNRVDKIEIAYAKFAKKVDMRKLKQAEWSILGLNEESRNNGTVNVSDGVGDETGTELTTFKDLYQSLQSGPILSSKLKDGLSVPLAFVALLHLCNEKELSGMSEYAFEGPVAMNGLASKSLRNRASMLNMLGRQSKSVVALALEDQVGAIDTTLGPEEKLRRLITLCISSSSAELQQEANDNSDGEDSELVDETATTIRRAPEALVEHLVMSEVAKKLDKAVKSIPNDRPVSRSLRAVRDYMVDLESEQKQWAKRRQELFDSYKSERRLRNEASKLDLEPMGLDLETTYSISSSMRERKRSLQEQFERFKTGLKTEEGRITASLAIQDASLTTAAKKINSMVDRRLQLRCAFTTEESKNMMERVSALVDELDQLSDF